MKTFLTCLVIFLLSFGIFFSTLRGVWGEPKLNQSITQPSMPFESSHERAPYVTMLTLIRSQKFDLSPTYAKFALPDAGEYNGKLYSFFPPAISVWATPFYLLGQIFSLPQVFVFGSVIIFSSLILVFLYLISSQIFKLSVSTSLFVAFTFGFASTFLSYSATVYQHPFTTFLLMFSFYSVWKYKTGIRGGWIWGLLIWTACGLSIFVDYPNAILFLPILLYFLAASVKSDKVGKRYSVDLRLSFFITSVVFVFLVGLHAYYNQSEFGKWNIMSNMIPRYQTEEVGGSNTGNIKVERSNTQTKKNDLLSQDRIPAGTYELTVASDRGIFYFSPIFIIALLGIFYVFHPYTREGGVLVSIVLVNLLLYASISDPWGGWAFGPRYLIPGMAVLSIFVGIALEKARFKSLLKIVTFLLFVISSAIALLGALTTNLVPPQGEAIFLKMNYGLLYSVEIFSKSNTGNFIFNTFLSRFISLLDFYAIMLILFICIGFVTLFIIPLFQAKEN